MPDAHTSKAMFYYMREGHYPRTLAIGAQSGARCFLPDEHPDASTVHGVWDNGVDGLSKQVHLILLGLPFETFGTEFSVSYIPEGKEGYRDQVFVGGINIAGKDTATVISMIREKVNTHFAQAA